MKWIFLHIEISDNPNVIGSANGLKFWGVELLDWMVSMEAFFGEGAT